MFLKSGWSNKIFLDPMCVEYLSVKEPLLTHLQNNKRRTAIYGLITGVIVMTKFSYTFDLQYRATAEVEQILKAYSSYWRCFKDYSNKSDKMAGNGDRIFDSNRE